MSNKSSDPQLSLAATVEDLVQRLLSEGGNPAELSYVLAATAIDLGFQMAPRPETALTVVLGAIGDVAKLHAEACDEIIKPEGGENSHSCPPGGTTIH